jgi:hypothetical protein
MMKTVLLIVSASLLLAASSVVVSATKPNTESFDVEIYAKGELWRSMSLRPPNLPGEYSYSFAIYRMPKNQNARTSEGEQVYAFQIISHLSGDSVNIEILALLEDPDTVSEAHPLHKFKKQTVGSYDLRAGDEATASEMSKLGAEPLKIKVVRRN